MNQLWHLNSHHALKLFRSNWMSAPCVQLQTVYMNKHFQIQKKLFTQTESTKIRTPNTPNNIQIDVLRRSLSSCQSNSDKRFQAFKDLKTNINPYLCLIRADRPIGSWLLFWPCGWSIALSAMPGELVDLKTIALFGMGAMIMRGAGCTINDLWDKDIDAQVERTKNRPLVNNEIKQLDAWVFLSGQLSAGLMILLQLNWTSIVIGACSLSLVTVYPLMKRITYWPQLFLGMTFNYGALLGWCATKGSIDLSVCLPLYIAGISWTIVYDTIYAHQDKVDDLIVGIKSTAIRFGDNTKEWLTAFSTAMMAGLLMSGYICDQTWPYYTAIGLVGAHLAQQITSLKIYDPGDCARKFLSNYQVGLLIFVGIILGNYLKSQNECKSTTNRQHSSTFMKMHVT